MDKLAFVQVLLEQEGIRETDYQLVLIKIV